MTPIGALLTTIALLATLVTRHGIAARARSDGVGAHLVRLLTLIALLLVVRLAIFQSVQSGYATMLVAILMVVAAWLPLATLRLAEELVRRHAPRVLKFVALGGAIAFSLQAVTLGLVWTRAAILALAVFQVVVIAGVVFHLWRERGSVSLAERRMADMLALALALCLPLLATDFERLFPGLPFRGGAFAALLFVLACSRLASEGSRALALIGDLAMALAAGWLGSMAAQIADAPVATHLPIAAVTAAVAALFLLIGRLRERQSQSSGLAAAMAASAGPVDAMLAAHPLLATAERLGTVQLVDMPVGMAAALAELGVVTADDTAGDAPLAGAARELLARHSATHLLALPQDPPAFLAIAGSALDEARLTTELRIALRLLEGAR